MKVQAKATQKFIHQTPRKVRVVADAVRGLSVDESLKMLEVMPQLAARTMYQVVTQAKANAISGKQAVPESLTISEVQVNDGPRLKRWRAVSRGRAHSIIKRFSHISVTVSGESQ